MEKPRNSEPKKRKKIIITVGAFERGALVDSSVHENIPAQEIPIEKIKRFEPESKMYSEKSSRLVQEIVDLINTGKKNELPPILVRMVEGGYEIIDGHHRYQAHIFTNCDTILVKIIPESEIEIIYKEDSGIESPFEKFGVSSLEEFQDRFLQLDQDLMGAKSSVYTFDYKENNLLNKMKDYLEKIDVSQISEVAKQALFEMLWLWYHHAAQDAMNRYQEKEKAIAYIDKALEYGKLADSQNEITELLSYLYRDEFEKANEYIEHMPDFIEELQSNASVKMVRNQEKDSAKQLFEDYKENKTPPTQ